MQQQSLLFGWLWWDKALSICSNYKHPPSTHHTYTVCHIQKTRLHKMILSLRRILLSIGLIVMSSFARYQAKQIHLVTFVYLSPHYFFYFFIFFAQQIILRYLSGYNHPLHFTQQTHSVRKQCGCKHLSPFINTLLTVDRTLCSGYSGGWVRFTVSFTR